jgi:hypothetical protein
MDGASTAVSGWGEGAATAPKVGSGDAMLNTLLVRQAYQRSVTAREGREDEAWSASSRRSYKRGTTYNLRQAWSEAGAPTLPA